LISTLYITTIMLKQSTYVTILDNNTNNKLAPDYAIRDSRQFEIRNLLFVWDLRMVIFEFAFVVYSCQFAKLEWRGFFWWNQNANHHESRRLKTVTSVTYNIFISIWILSINICELMFYTHTHTRAQLHYEYILSLVSYFIYILLKSLRSY